MRGLGIATVALVWLAACGPRDRANRTGDVGGVADTDRVGNETGMTGDTAPVTRGGAGASDSMDAAGILTTLSTANLQEIQEAKYVRSNARSAAVKSLARTLETDHAANLAKGRKLALELGVSQRLPSDSAPSKGAPAQLEGVRGAALDSAFVAHQAEAHQANIDRIRNRMLPTAQEPKLQQYLQQTVTAMEGHLRQIEAVRQQLGHD
jgi:putative membrane protein